MTDRATLVAYDAEWPIRFAAEKRIIEAALGPGALVEHIGSTAVPGLESEARPRHHGRGRTAL